MKKLIEEDKEKERNKEYLKSMKEIGVEVIK